MQNQERTPSKNPFHRGGSTRHQSSINELRENLRDFTQTDFHKELLCSSSRSIRRSSPRIVLSHRSRANGTHRHNGIRDLTKSTHHVGNGSIKTTKLCLSSQSKFIDLAKNNLLTQLLLLTATLKFCLKLSEFNTVVRGFIGKRLEVSKGFITESTVVSQRLHIDFLSVLIGVVLSLQLTVLCLKSRHYILITTTKETTKETVAVIRAIEDTQSETCDTSTETCTRNTLRSKFSHNYIPF
nr:MAG TPA: hypothetical protein [Caudoviricetes sp.]